MSRNFFFTLTLSLIFCLLAQQASAQYSRSIRRHIEEYHEERAEDIEKFKNRMKKDRSAMAKGLKQCDFVRGSIDSNAEYFILYNVTDDEKLDDIVKEMNEQFVDLKTDHIQCVLFSSIAEGGYSSPKQMKKYLSRNKIRIPMIDRSTIYQNAYKYNGGRSKRVYPIYYLYYVADFESSFGTRMRVHYRNAEKITDSVTTLTEALEAIKQDREKR